MADDVVRYVRLLTPAARGKTEHGLIIHGVPNRAPQDYSLVSTLDKERRDGMAGARGKIHVEPMSMHMGTWSLSASIGEM
jgi:hypothetical protein